MAKGRGWRWYLQGDGGVDSAESFGFPAMKSAGQTNDPVAMSGA